MDANDDETIDSDTCSFLLHCEYKTVEDLARRGIIPGLKLGKSWMFLRSQVLEAARALAATEAKERVAPAQPADAHRPKRQMKRPPPVLPDLP
ncbi:MAG: helix-turn-helix domain-containing protein [Betaproteobacteria bacterium]|nr:helix-turn-helix domain-containing protein [Betaproteobacteria bacterium]